MRDDKCVNFGLVNLKRINNKGHKQQGIDRPLHTLEDSVWRGLLKMLATVAKSELLAAQQL